VAKTGPDGDAAHDDRGTIDPLTADGAESNRTKD
jgi:hypothetical protein